MNEEQLKDWTEHRSLKGIPTRTLLGWRDWAYKYGGQYDPTGVQSSERTPNTMIPSSAIIAELNTREHIPNKVEAKTNRRAAAQASHGQGKGMNR